MPTSYTYKYPRPMVTVDLVVFALSQDGLRALFIRRKNEPFAGQWAIPGGYLEMDEPVEAGARRELKEETGLVDLVFVSEIGVFGEPGRDPRGRTISIAYIGVVKGPPPAVEGGDDAAGAAWLDPMAIDGLAFDHDDILAAARDQLSIALFDDQLLLAILPGVFTPRDLDLVFEVRIGNGNWTSRWITTSLGRGVIERLPGRARRYREIPIPQ